MLEDVFGEEVLVVRDVEDMPVDSMMQTEGLVKEAWCIWEANRGKWWVEIRWGMRRTTFYGRRA